MNEEQVKSIIRWLISIFGSGIAAWFAARGWFTADQVTSFLNNPALVGVLVALSGLAWGIISHTHTNTVIAAANVSPDTRVVTKPEIAASAQRSDVTSADKTKVVAKAGV